MNYKEFGIMIVGTAIITVVSYSTMIYIAHTYYPIWGVFAGITCILVYQFLTMVVMVGDK